MAEKDTGKSEKKNKSSEKKGGGNILQIIILVLLVAVLGLGGFIAWKLMNMQPSAPGQQAQASAPAPDPGPRKPGILLEMDNVTVNLADPEESRFLRVKIKLEVANEEDKMRIEELKTQIRDLVITVLSSKTFADVRSPQGKFALKEELVYRINNLAGGHPVKTLYFSDFVAQ